MLKKYPPFILEKSGKQPCPLLLASPHSGTFYPERLFHLTDLKLSDVQKYEDACVNKLFSFAPAMGIPMISAVYGRAWVDLNRHPLELDDSLFYDKIPPQALTNSMRVKHGYGVIPRQINTNTLIYAKKLCFETEQHRLFDVHFPYHNTLSDLIKRTITKFGKSILLDLHSMPELPDKAKIKGVTPDFVLGTNDGDSCAFEIYSKVAEILESLGFFVTINMPYSGAYTTLYYGKPAQKSHVIQIEVARHLYWNEKEYGLSENFNNMWHKMSVFIEKLIQYLSAKG